MKDKKFVITIGRQYGSGGRLIGELLAKSLGVKCYDKELLTLAAKQSGFCEDLFMTHDEKPNSSFIYSLVMDTYALSYATNTQVEMPLNHKIFLAQFETIKKLAKTENCIIVGRCADYVLENKDFVSSFFISADEEDRINRIVSYENIEKEKARDRMLKTDKKRASYYNYYSNKVWGEATSYDLSINSSKLGIENTVKLLKSYIEMKI